jgi:hypothetical protein
MRLVSPKRPARLHNPGAALTDKCVAFDCSANEDNVHGETMTYPLSDDGLASYIQR